MPKRGGRINQWINWINQNEVNEQLKANTQRAPQGGPMTENNAPQKALIFDLMNPRKFTRPSIPQPVQLGHRSKKHKAG